MGYKPLDYFSNYDVVYKRAVSEVEHQMDLYVDEMDGNLRIALARQKSWVRTDVDTYDWIYRMSFKYKCYRLLYNLVKEQNILSYSQLYLLALDGDNVTTAVSQLEDMLDIEEINNTISMLENSDTTFDTCLKLSALYNVREHLKPPANDV